jgi:hypothetical protein
MPSLASLSLSEFVILSDHLAEFLTRYPTTSLTDLTISRCPASHTQITPSYEHRLTFAPLPSKESQISTKWSNSWRPHSLTSRRAFPVLCWKAGPDVLHHPPKRANRTAHKGAGYKRRCGDNRHIAYRLLPFDRARGAGLAGSQCSFVQLCVHQKKGCQVEAVKEGGHANDVSNSK